MTKFVSLHEKYERNQESELIKEDLDISDLDNVARAFDKIDEILGSYDSKLPAIDGPLEKAKQDLNNMLSGEGGIIKRMFNDVTGQKQKTLDKVMETQIQLVSLFRSLPSILTIAGKKLKEKIANAPSGAVRNTSPSAGGVDVSRLSGGGEDENLDSYRGQRANTVLDAIDDPLAIKNLTNLIVKALKPESLKSVSINPKMAAQQILELSPEEFSQLARRAGGGELRVPISKDEMQSLSNKVSSSSGESGGRAQELLQNLTKGDKTRAKAYNSLIDELQGLTGQDIQLIKKGLERYLGGGSAVPA